MCARAKPGGDEVSALAHEFNRMADDLQQRAAALSASDKARRQLLADVSHELMTPLTAIRGYTRNAVHAARSRSTPTPAAAISRSSTRKPTSSRQSSATCSTSRDSREAAKRSTIAPVSVEELFRRILDRHHPSIQQKQIAVTMDVAPEAAEVTGDAGRLEQALQNLASNAIRHIPQGGSLTLRADADEGRRSHRGAGFGARHPARAPAARLRSLLQGGRLARRHQRPIGQRPRPVDRPGDRATARRRRARRRTRRKAAPSSRSCLPNDQQHQK